MEFSNLWIRKANIPDLVLHYYSEWVKSIADLLNVELDDLNALSTPDTSPFSVTLRLPENFPVSIRTLV